MNFIQKWGSCVIPSSFYGVVTAGLIPFVASVLDCKLSHIFTFAYLYIFIIYFFIYLLTFRDISEVIVTIGLFMGVWHPCGPLLCQEGWVFVQVTNIILSAKLNLCWGFPLRITSQPAQDGFEPATLLNRECWMLSQRAVSVSFGW